MPLFAFSALIFGTAVLAGLLGALTGLGGGVVIVPVLIILFKVDIHYAIGASLVSVIATSSGAAVAYVREGYSNVRIGMFLEVATTLGAILGAWLTTRVSSNAISIVFGLVLLYSALASLRSRHDSLVTDGSPLARRLKLTGTLPDDCGNHQPYTAQRVPLGFSVLFGAGALSGLLGIGSGAVKVLGMDQAMELPFKVSTTTSNFMIGVTAAASAGVYLAHGYIDPGLSMPVMLGVLAGSLLGAKLLVHVHPVTLKRVFAGVITVLAAEMIYRGWKGSL
ncbi:TSUP family transporter [Granulicella sp. 5B5]|uniref:sulfite exporter TauE/SafE family protein n=1 Tax=Granulicella sp. 5B5 TaxID=1617967 RepID=UPI0015F6ADCF|nr:sulfite exporter TauE/SafE family protein [Granulicella sp. 5B5]QMV18038.1 TSUP family transporter [Granulicella sp. 5B5]